MIPVGKFICLVLIVGILLLSLTYALYVEYRWG